MVTRFQKCKKTIFEIFFKKFSRFCNFYTKIAVFLNKLFSKRAHWNLLIFAPHVVQTFPEPTTCSELMSIFCQGLPRKKVRCPQSSSSPLAQLWGESRAAPRRIGPKATWQKPHLYSNCHLPNCHCGAGKDIRDDAGKTKKRQRDTHCVQCKRNER